ncbi:predicted protein [Botrytis cinerea T4]|uniref:Uncharacterized protein n=1 Tax=Botryotinia fuckeliana (strain T4) TaxID=999810 RepID=G2YJM8_BOTF4|nr:predicted protein [Botrytis cinerea T4]
MGINGWAKQARLKGLLYAEIYTSADHVLTFQQIEFRVDNDNSGSLSG